MTVIYIGNLFYIKLYICLKAYLTNESLPACRTASKQGLQAGVSIILGFSKENNASSFHGSLPL